MVPVWFCCTGLEFVMGRLTEPHGDIVPSFRDPFPFTTDSHHFRLPRLDEPNFPSPPGSRGIWVCSRLFSNCGALRQCGPRIAKRSFIGGRTLLSDAGFRFRDNQPGFPDSGNQRDEVLHLLLCISSADRSSAAISDPDSRNRPSIGIRLVGRNFFSGNSGCLS